MNELLGGPEAALRRALHAAAEQVEPGDDGLDRIRARVRHRRPMPLPIAWVDVALTKLSLRVPDGFWVIWDRVAREVRAVTDHFLPERLRSERLRLRLGWLRPVAAMSVVVFLVAAAVSMAIEVPQVLAPAGPAANQSNNLGTQQQPGAGGGNGGHPQAKQSNPSGNPTSSPGGPSSSPCPSKPASPAPINSSPTSSQTSPAQSPSPTASATPSPSASATPTPSASQSSGQDDAIISPSTVGADGAGLAAGSANSGTAAGNNTLRTTGTKSHASPSPSPCASKTSSQSSTAHPQAVGAVPWSLSAVLSAAEFRARS